MCAKSPGGRPIPGCVPSSLRNKWRRRRWSGCRGAPRSAAATITTRTWRRPCGTHMLVRARAKGRRDSTRRDDASPEDLTQTSTNSAAPAHAIGSDAVRPEPESTMLWSHHASVRAGSGGARPDPNLHKLGRTSTRDRVRRRPTRARIHVSPVNLLPMFLLIHASRSDTAVL